MPIRRPAMLQRNTLGRSGFEVSLLGFGAEAIGREGRSFEDAQRTLNGVLDLGVNLIDTASAYGFSEEFIGRALAARHRLAISCSPPSVAGTATGSHAGSRPRSRRRSINR